MTKKRGVGNPTKYDPETTPQRVKEYCEKGLINTEIAKKLGIDVSTFYNWQAAHVELLEAIKEGKRVVDDEVEQVLYNTAKGGLKFTDVTRELAREGD